MRRFWKVLKLSAAEFQKDNAARIGAAIAFYAIFSLAPLIMVVIAAAGSFIDEHTVREALLGEMGRLFGSEGRMLLTGLLNSTAVKEVGFAGTVLGIITICYGATKIFVQLQDALNTIWDAENLTDSLPLAMTVKSRLRSFGLVIGIGFLLVVSLAVDAALNTASQLTSSFIGLPDSLFQSVNLLISFAGFSVLFSAMFKVLPDKKLRWAQVWQGGSITAALFMLGEHLIGIYLGNTTVGEGFGPAGTLVMMLLWIYYSSQIFLFGAEITEVLSRESFRAAISRGGAAKAEESSEQQRLSFRRVEAGSNGVSMQSPELYLQRKRDAVKSKLLAFPGDNVDKAALILSPKNWAESHTKLSAAVSFLLGVKTGEIVFSDAASETESKMSKAMKALGLGRGKDRREIASTSRLRAKDKQRRGSEKEGFAKVFLEGVQNVLGAALKTAVMSGITAKTAAKEMNRDDAGADKTASQEV